MESFLQAKLASVMRRVACLDDVLVAAHNALQLPCFRRKKCTKDHPDRWYWYHSKCARRAAIVTLETALSRIDWHLPRARIEEIEDVYTRAQQEIRQLAKSWDRYMNVVNRLARIHNHKTYTIPFPDDDLTQRYCPRLEYVPCKDEPTKRSLRQKFSSKKY